MQFEGDCDCKTLLFCGVFAQNKGFRVRYFMARECGPKTAKNEGRVPLVNHCPVGKIARHRNNFAKSIFFLMYKNWNVLYVAQADLK